MHQSESVFRPSPLNGSAMMTNTSYFPDRANTHGRPAVEGQPYLASSQPAPREDFIDWQKWRDPVRIHHLYTIRNLGSNGFTERTGPGECAVAQVSRV